MTVARDIADLAAKQVLDLLGSQGRLSAEVANGTLGSELFRDLSRARYMSKLRGEVRSDQRHLNAISEEIQRLVALRSADVTNAASTAAAAAIVFLVLIAKDMLIARTEGSGAQVVVASKALFLALRESQPDLAAELALQLVHHEESDDYMEFLLSHQDLVERLRGQYFFETRSPSELHEAIVTWWRTLDHNPQGDLGGLSPFLQSSPAPGDASQAVALVGEFADALEHGKEERDRRLAVWLQNAAKLYRLIQWEYFTQVKGIFQGQGVKGLPVYPGDEFLRSLTESWWNFVFEYEPTGAGRPARRKNSRHDHREVTRSLVAQSENTLATFKQVLDRLDLFAGPKIHDDLTQTIRDEWAHTVASGRAGILLVHDAELTFFSLLWLLADQSGPQIPHYQENPPSFQWRNASSSELLSFTGLAVKATDNVYLLTPRWRSLVHWLRLGQGARSPNLEKRKERSSCSAEGCFEAEGIYRTVADWCSKESVPLNRATSEQIDLFLTCVSSSVKCGTESCLAERRRRRIVLGSRAAYLPLETLLRAYRPWCSQLIVATLHASRAPGDLQLNPISYGFATIVGDLSADAFKALSPTNAVDPHAAAAFQSWIYNPWSLLAGIGMSLGVSSSMATEALTGDERDWVRRLWPQKQPHNTPEWFAPGGTPGHTWCRNGFDDHIKPVMDHLRAITGLSDEFWMDINTRPALWEELKHFFGCTAVVSPRGTAPDGAEKGERRDKRRLTLGGVFLLILAYLKHRGVAPEQLNALVKERVWGLRSPIVAENAPFEVDRRIALHLLVRLFSELFYDENRELKIKEISLEENGLWLVLDFPCLIPSSPSKRRALWSCLLSQDKGGYTTQFIRDYRELAAAAAEGHLPSEIVVSPCGQKLDQTKFGFVEWKLRARQ